MVSLAIISRCTILMLVLDQLISLKLNFSISHSIGKSLDSVASLSNEVNSIHIESLQAGPIFILVESLVLCIMIDKSRSKGIHEVKHKISFLKSQMDHYHHRKGVVDSILK